LFLLAIGVIAMDVIDDPYLQPESGTAGDHLVSGLVPLAVLGARALRRIGAGLNAKPGPSGCISAPSSRKQA
jgi:hypothetical protein